MLINVMEPKSAAKKFGAVSREPERKISPDAEMLQIEYYNFLWK